jgi:hypothetical protein
VKYNSSSKEDMGYVEPEKLNLAVLRAATNNFSQENKLGEGETWRRFWRGVQGIFSYIQS